jgi:hypothetical protein
MVQCKKECAADKMCNPKSGRCVLKTGAIGMALLGKTRVNPKTVESGRIKPLTRAQVIAQRPKTTPVGYNSGGHTYADYLKEFRSIYGKHVHYLTRELARQLVGKEIVTIDTRDMYSTKREFERALETSVIIDPDSTLDTNLTSFSKYEIGGLYGWEEGAIVRKILHGGYESHGRLNNYWHTYGSEPGDLEIVDDSGIKKELVREGSGEVLVFLNL